MVLYWTNLITFYRTTWFLLNRFSFFAEPLRFFAESNHFFKPGAYPQPVMISSYTFGKDMWFNASIGEIPSKAPENLWYAII